MPDRHAGGDAMAAGVLSFSRRVMTSVGTRLMRLDALNALIAVSSMAASTHIFAAVGVPVSTSQAIIGAIFGIGLVENLHNVKSRMLRIFGAGWVLTPVVAFLFSATGYAIFA